MFYQVEPVKTEQVLEITDPIYMWVNIPQAHAITIQQCEYLWWVKVIFSENEEYYISSFDCEKAAKRYVRDVVTPYCASAM